MGGAFSSHQPPADSSIDGLNTSTVSSRVRKSKRLMEKFRSRQSSTRSDEVSQTSSAIDLVLSHVAQNPHEGEIQSTDHNSCSTADMGERKQKLTPCIEVHRFFNSALFASLSQLL